MKSNPSSRFSPAMLEVQGGPRWPTSFYRSKARAHLPIHLPVANFLDSTVVNVSTGTENRVLPSPSSLDLPPCPGEERCTGLSKSGRQKGDMIDIIRARKAASEAKMRPIPFECLSVGLPVVAEPSKRTRHVTKHVLSLDGKQRKTPQAHLSEGANNSDATRGAIQLVSSLSPCALVCSAPTPLSGSLHGQRLKEEPEATVNGKQYNTHVKLCRFFLDIGFRSGNNKTARPPQWHDNRLFRCRHLGNGAIISRATQSQSCRRWLHPLLLHLPRLFVPLKARPTFLPQKRRQWTPR